MQQAIQKASVLIEALPYIQRFRDAIIVVKFGGSAMEVPANAQSVMADIAFMECAGMSPVIVHGGGKAISRGLTKQGIKSEFIQGLRVTSDETIKVVEQVLVDEVGPAIVSLLTARGAKAASINGKTVFKVIKKSELDAITGKSVNWGLVGDPSEVDTDAISALIADEIIPVISPLGIGPDNKTHNINADEAATAVARALKARKLAFLSDVPGLLRNTSDPKSIISTLTITDVDKLIKEGVIAGGMLPKVRSAIAALEAGVKKIHIVDGRMPHSLLLEIFTDQGVGTEIVGSSRGL
ncbi:MAG: acetylglutamate kinase [Lentisphaerae bacterium]|nr:acetylglutamate kinase [Lentisphaerota bacterium]